MTAERDFRTWFSVFSDHAHQHEGRIQGLYLCRQTPTTSCECRKPHTLLYERAMSDLGVTPDDVWVVGDTSNDLGAANQLGVPGLLVRTGFGQSAERDPTPREAVVKTYWPPPGTSSSARVGPKQTRAHRSRPTIVCRGDPRPFLTVLLVALTLAGCGGEPGHAWPKRLRRRSRCGPRPRLECGRQPADRRRCVRLQPHGRRRRRRTPQAGQHRRRSQQTRPGPRQARQRHRRMNRELATALANV